MSLNLQLISTPLILTAMSEVLIFHYFNCYKQVVMMYQVAFDICLFPNWSSSHLSSPCIFRWFKGRWVIIFAFKVGTLIQLYSDQQLFTFENERRIFNSCLCFCHLSSLFFFIAPIAQIVFVQSHRLFLYSRCTAGQFVLSYVLTYCQWTRSPVCLIFECTLCLLYAQCNSLSW